MTYGEPPLQTLEVHGGCTALSSQYRQPHAKNILAFCQMNGSCTINDLSRQLDGWMPSTPVPMNGSRSILSSLVENSGELYLSDLGTTPPLSTEMMVFSRSYLGPLDSVAGVELKKAKKPFTASAAVKSLSFCAQSAGGSRLNATCAWRPWDLPQLTQIKSGSSRSVGYDGIGTLIPAWRLGR
jgi:hypothetical protein